MSPAEMNRGKKPGPTSVPPGRRGAGVRTPPTSAAARAALRRQAIQQQPRLVLGPLNYGLMAAGVLAVVVGFVLLADNEISLAPLLLVLGYCVLIPAGLLIERVRARNDKSGPAAESGGE